MAEKRVPFKNPVSGRLLCPIRDFKECEREKCFFWRKGDPELDHIYEHTRPPPWIDNREFEKDNCLLFILALLAEPFFLDVRNLLEAAGKRPDPDQRHDRPNKKSKVVRMSDKRRSRE